MYELNGINIFLMLIFLLLDVFSGKHVMHRDTAAQ
jgi:hypothetical protein